GSMARNIAKYRPKKPIHAISQHEGVLRGLALCWGIEGILLQDLNTNIDEALWEVEKMLLTQGKLAPGDSLVLTAGLPFAERKATNMLRVDVVE
ncbi:MAG TPA: pyruvate kinase alpha/beta domain-containing protein, partial [bacterium]|nr:pyruvate kinase alpha/beta domain-containing protein [bacterium]